MKYLTLTLLAATFGLSGCASVVMPDWTNPGTADLQRRRAEQFDPYAETDVAPEIAGGRPRGYQKPLPEPLRAKWTLRGGDPRF